MVRLLLLLFATLICLYSCSNPSTEWNDRPPNILFCIADDWGWPHAGVYGDEVVNTPTFDRLAREGVLFEHAFISSPSCTPSRSAILTGQQFWRLGESANLWSTLDIAIPVYPLIMKEAGYHVGRSGKSWGPGNLEVGGYIDSHPAGDNYPDGFSSFISSRKDNKPFSFWLGTSDPHRPYELGIGRKTGINVEAVETPDFYPDEEIIKSDLADYYFEVQRFDSLVGHAMEVLDSLGELENTIIVMTGDHGMPFPRGKGNLYDMGSRVPLALRWGSQIDKSIIIKDFVSLVDLAPTFLEAAGISIPDDMNGKSLLPLIRAHQEGASELIRTNVVYGRERHVPAQAAPSIVGYPSRAIRNKDYLYIYNFEPDRWPAGVPNGASHPMNVFADCDNGPTKTYLISQKNSEVNSIYYNLSFGKRPQEELYLIADDPDQINNIADDPTLSVIKSGLKKELFNILEKDKDPRMVGNGKVFDSYPYRSGYKLNK